VRNRRRKLTLLGLVLVLVFGLCAILIPSGPPDPIYDGNPLSYWLKQPPVSEYLGSLHRTVSIARSVQVDTNAIPRLIATIRNDNGVQKHYARYLHRLPGWLQKRLPAPVPEGVMRDNAVDLLVQLGDDARPAIPALADILKNGREAHARYEAAMLLAMIGKGDPVARQALIDAAQADPYRSKNALEMLKAVDPVAAAQLLTNSPPALTNATPK
jgi:hypothetical protein